MAIRDRIKKFVSLSVLVFFKADKVMNWKHLLLFGAFKFKEIDTNEIFPSVIDNGDMYSIMLDEDIDKKPASANENVIDHNNNEFEAIRIMSEMIELKKPPISEQTPASLIETKAEIILEGLYRSTCLTIG